MGAAALAGTARDTVMHRARRSMVSFFIKITYPFYCL